MHFVHVFRNVGWIAISFIISLHGGGEEKGGEGIFVVPRLAVAWSRALIEFYFVLHSSY